MVPMLATTSSCDMPMPLSLTVIVRASLSKRDADREVGVALVELGMRERLEAQLVGGVRGVGDELAQEDLRVAVQRVDHEVQQLLHLGLESERLATRRGCGPAVLAVDFRHFDFLQLVERADRGGAPGATDRGSGISLPGGVFYPAPVRRRSPRHRLDGDAAGVSNGGV